MEERSYSASVSSGGSFIADLHRLQSQMPMPIQPPDGSEIRSQQIRSVRSQTDVLSSRPALIKSQAAVLPWRQRSPRRLLPMNAQLPVATVSPFPSSFRLYRLDLIEHFQSVIRDNRLLVSSNRVEVMAVMAMHCDRSGNLCRFCSGLGYAVSAFALFNTYTTRRYATKDHPMIEARRWLLMMRSVRARSVNKARTKLTSASS